MAALDAEVVEDVAGVLGVLHERVLRVRVRRRRTLAEASGVDANDAEAFCEPSDQVIPSPHGASARRPQQQRGLALASLATLAIDLDVQRRALHFHFHVTNIPIKPSIDPRWDYS